MKSNQNILIQHAMKSNQNILVQHAKPFCLCSQIQMRMKERQKEAHSTDVRQVTKLCATYCTDTGDISNYT